MPRLQYSDAAQRDLADIARYIAWESGSVTVAREFVGQLRARCRKLASLPGTLGTTRPELGLDIRSTPHHNYVIFFRYLGEVLDIINVLERHRDIDAYYGH